MKRVWYVGKGGKKSPASVRSLQRLLLRQRGVAAADIATFFTPTYERAIHDPRLLSDVPVAVERIFRAIKKHERILVHGDYDADGVSSTAILVNVITELGGNVAPHLPNRADDGYGLRHEALETLRREMDLLIAVDCGISSVAEVANLRQHGIDTIIIDHHTIPTQLPRALAIIHPRHPKAPYVFPWLCGAGLAWKVAQALLRHRDSPYHNDPDHEKWLLDLAAIGTVADVVPLQGENRAIVRFGLEVLRHSQRPGLRALLANTRISPVQLSSEDISWRVVSRLNAAGRMADAAPALELLLTADEERASQLLTLLNFHNQQRQLFTRRVLREAEAHIELSFPLVFAADASWPSGVVGLAASRLAEKFQRPAIVVGRAGTRLVGSARGPEGTNVLKLLEGGRDFLVKLGGHTQAAGFTVTDGKLGHFKEALLRQAVTSNTPKTLELYADTVIASALVNQTTVDALRHFAPFGEGNRQPTFILNHLALLNVRAVGSNQRHAKFMFRADEEVIEGIGFGLYQAAQAVGNLKKPLAVAGQLEENEYRGQRHLQLKVKDIAPADTVTIKESRE